MSKQGKNAETSNFLDVNIASLGRQPLSQQVYEKLKEIIIKGDLTPGTKLTEIEVAKRMNVSATPVREAFRRLATEGFIKIEPWKGVSVLDLAAKDIIETYQCREALEGFACRLASENMDAKGVKKLRALLAREDKIKDPNDVVKINTEIHNVIMEYAQNEKLAGMLSLFRNMIMHHRHMTAYIDIRRRQIYNEHKEIVDALEKKDADSAEKGMRLHVQNGLRYYQYLSKKEQSQTSSNGSR